MLAYFLIVLILALLGSLVYGIIKRQLFSFPLLVFSLAPLLYFMGTKITEILGLGQLIV